MLMITVFVRTLVILLLILLALIFGYPVGYFILQTNVQMQQQALQLDKEHASAQGVGSYVINLDRSPNRYIYVKDHITALGFPFHRISAVDESKMTQYEKDKNLDIQTYHSYMASTVESEPGTIGCYLSHVKTWQEFLASDYQYALIFEDDVSFKSEILRSVVDELVKNDHLWDITTFDIGHRGNPLRIKSLANNDLVVYLGKVLHTGAYIINRQAAINMLSKALPIKMPVDRYFTRVWELDLKFTGIEPKIVQQTFGENVIFHDLRKDSTSKFAKLRQNIIRAQSHVIRFLYNLREYLAAKFA
jgi:glycosyl transferase family 25